MFKEIVCSVTATQAAKERDLFSCQPMTKDWPNKESIHAPVHFVFAGSWSWTLIFTGTGCFVCESEIIGIFLIRVVVISMEKHHHVTVTKYANTHSHNHTHLFIHPQVHTHTQSTPYPLKTWTFFMIGYIKDFCHGCDKDTAQPPSLKLPCLHQSAPPLTLIHTHTHTRQQSLLSPPLSTVSHHLPVFLHGSLD